MKQYFEQILTVGMILLLLLIAGLSYRGNQILQQRDVQFDEFRNDQRQLVERQIRTESKLDALLIAVGDKATSDDLESKQTVEETK